MKHLYFSLKKVAILIPLFITLMVCTTTNTMAQEWWVGTAINKNEDYMDLDNNDNYAGGPLRVGMIVTETDGKTWSGLRQWDPDSNLYGGLIIDANTSYDIYLKSRRVGIGLDNPSDKLHVYNGNIRISDPNSTTRLNFYSGSSSRFTMGQHKTGEAFLWNESNDYMQFATNNTERFRISSAGKVRVGSGNASEYFEVYPDTDVSAIIGKAKIGFISNYTDMAGFAHYDNYTSSSYALLQKADGTTLINAKSGKLIDLRINNSTKVRLASNGYLGVGTTSPQTTLDVNGTIVAGGKENGLYNSSDNGTPLDGGEGIILPGGTSQYNISVQDGNGRIQHKWNATTGTSEKFLVGNEDAAFIDMGVEVSNDDWIAFKWADGSGKAAGESISWGTHFAINNLGNVGIGVTNSQYKLNVGGTFRANGASSFAESATFEKSASFEEDANFESQVYIGSRDHSSFNNHAIDQYELIVEGDVIAKRVVAAPSNEWPDYVFEEEYELAPLSEVASFIEEKGHLPNMPSAAEVKESGVDVVEVERILLEKVEELTLYVIELEKKVAEIEQKKSKREKRRDRKK
ncbi:hypothetical protein [Flammeovirga sp. EKP202]|uniref:hypothetical protein n=1 Tax=Flammeovirga sp. EKP202 TaxID=2770592 RepID=UPI00165F9ECD|nr:hypothetical protein [Flammeovirga sp. EKP202]MBD0401803.1 hypothetical protein [Flammeovirga sp. EKP202]